MNGMQSLMAALGGAAQDIFKTVKGGLSSLGFLKPLGLIMAGGALFLGLLSALGVKLNKTAWKQILIALAIIGVMVSMGELVSRHQAANGPNPSDPPTQNAMTAPLPDNTGNVFNYPDPNHPGQMQNPVTGVVIPNAINGLSVDGSNSALGQQGTYGFSIVPANTGQKPTLTVESPENPPSDSAANMRLKDAAVYNFLKTVPKP